MPHLPFLSVVPKARIKPKELLLTVCPFVLSEENLGFYLLVSPMQLTCIRES